MYQIKVVEKNETHFMFNTFLFFQIVLFMR